MVDMEDDIVTGALVIFLSALDDLVVTRVVEVGTTVVVADAPVVADIGVPVVFVPPSDAFILTEAIVNIVGTAVGDAFACVIMDEFAAIQEHEHIDTQACACCMQHIKKSTNFRCWGRVICQSESKRYCN